MKTHSFHWNVTGRMFIALHTMFEQQYTALAEAVDLIAERIRALGFPAPGSYSQYAKLGAIKEKTGVPEAMEMIRQLVDGQAAVVRTAREAFTVAEKANDQPTAELLTVRGKSTRRTHGFCEACSSRGTINRPTRCHDDSLARRAARGRKSGPDFSESNNGLLEITARVAAAIALIIALAAKQP